MASHITKELFVFEGFTNRVNALASALLRWEDGFLIRWMENQHCPVPFTELFEPFPGVEVTSQPGSWREYHYENSEDRLCHYFLSTDRQRREVKKAYELILQQCRIDDYGVEVKGIRNSVALHYRRHIEWEKASESSCLDFLAVLLERTAAEHVVIASDDDETGLRLAESVRSMGLSVSVLGQGAGLASDLDRDVARVREFVKIWRTLTLCPWSISNAISSTVLDASRALGNEVWTFGDPGSRVGNGCAFFNRFGFDWLIVGPAQQVKPKEERMIPTSFGKYGKKLISYCLFGSDPLYLGGILRNLGEAETVYPDWQVIVFVDSSIGTCIREQVVEAGGIVIEARSGLPLTVERFLPAIDEEVEFLIVRDADSSLTRRESVAVEAWMTSGKSWHVMRDHPYHQAAVMGGMWGCCGGCFDRLLEFLKGYEFSGSYGEDQEFLKECVWKFYQKDALVHDSHGSFDREVRPYPEDREGRRFVGERVDQGGEPIAKDHEMIEEQEY
jgi:hypothetical protein